MKPNTVFKRAYNRGSPGCSGCRSRPTSDQSRRWSRSARRQPDDRPRHFGGACGSRADRRRRAAQGAAAPARRRPTSIPRSRPSRVGAIVEKRFMHWILRRRLQARAADQRARTLAAVRRLALGDPRLSQPLQPIRSSRATAQRQLGVQGLHRGIRRRAVRGAGRCSNCARRSGSSRLPPTIRPGGACRGSSRSISICLARRKPVSPTSPSSTSDFIAASTTHRATASSSASTT